MSMFFVCLQKKKWQSAHELADALARVHANGWYGGDERWWCESTGSNVMIFCVNHSLSLITNSMNNLWKILLLLLLLALLLLYWCCWVGSISIESFGKKSINLSSTHFCVHANWIWLHMCQCSVTIAILLMTHWTHVCVRDINFVIDEFRPWNEK